MLKTYAQAKLSKVQYFQTILGFFLSMTLSRCVWASLPPCILLQVCLGISSPLHPVCPFPFIIHETNAFSMASRYTPLATRQFLSTWLCNWVNYVHLISVVLVHIVHVRDTSNYDESSSCRTLVPLQYLPLPHCSINQWSSYCRMQSSFHIQFPVIFW